MRGGALLIAAILAAAPATGQDGSGDRGSADGFYAMTVMTSDPDWQATWRSVPPEAAVKLPEATVLHVGETAWILTAFANPQLRDGEIDIRCDLKITRPDGSEIAQPATACAGGPPEGDARNLQLTGMLIEMAGEAGDARGIWTAEIGITDAVRGVRVPLTFSYELQDAEAAE